MKARTCPVVSENAASSSSSTSGFSRSILSTMLRKSGIASSGTPCWLAKSIHALRSETRTTKSPATKPKASMVSIGQRDELRIGGGPGLAEDVHVELVELAAPALLRFLVAETLADLEPLERLGEIALVLGDEACQRGGHLRAAA